MELISPKLDVVFKKLFIDNLDLLRHFVSCALGLPLESIRDFRLTPTELLPRDVEGKFSRMDISMSVGERFVNLEIQVRKYPDFHDRVLFYWAQLFTAGLEKGDEYGRLRQTISINILDFILFPERKQYLTKVQPVVLDSGKVFSDKMVLNFLELRKVSPGDGTGALELWLKFFNAKSEEDFQMLQKHGNPAVNKAIDAIYAMSGDAGMRERARLREMALHDEASALAGAKAEGLAEGLAEGEAKGRGEVMELLVKQGLLSSQQARAFLEGAGLR